MTAGLVEIGGFFCIFVACGLVVAAAAMVSVPLAVLAAGVILLFIGILAVYVAQRLPEPTPEKVAP